MLPLPLLLSIVAAAVLLLLLSREDATRVATAAAPTTASLLLDKDNAKDSEVFDVLVYGSTPSGIMAAVAASRHLHATNHDTTNNAENKQPPRQLLPKVALLSQRAHIGGMCAGGLGETDVGSCADQVIGGLTLEFFARNMAQYEIIIANSSHHKLFRKWNLEPHIASKVFRDMLDEAGVVLLPFDQVTAVTMTGTFDDNRHYNRIERIVVTSGTSYQSRVFVDASYEGDLMARVPGLAYTVGRESRHQYNESGAGSGGPGRRISFGIEYMDPYREEDDNYDTSTNRTGTMWRNNGSGTTYDHGSPKRDDILKQQQQPRKLLPLLQSSLPKPRGQADQQVQAYNFRLCVTNDTALRVPFRQPDSYHAPKWELLRRFWNGWYNSTDPYKQAQAAVPSAILGILPSSYAYASSTSNQSNHDNTTHINKRQGMKFDMNNCGYNPIHTDMIGNSFAYPEADYDRREEIWQDHVSYTKEFLWFMSSDPSVPAEVRYAFRNEWGYCGDEFPDTDHFSPQLYVREARRLVGDNVLTQHDVLNKTTLGNRSIGMGCYGFDSHCVTRYACTDARQGCRLYNTSYVATEAGTEIMDNPQIYQIPWSVLLPPKSQVTNLLVSVCVSASHVAYSTVRMEPQYMIMGHAAGVVAALALRPDSSFEPRYAVVQDIDVDQLNELLVQDGQLVSLNASGGFRADNGDTGVTDVAQALQQQTGPFSSVSLH